VENEMRKVNCWIIVGLLLVICCVFVGCQSGVTLTTSTSLFYPDIKTSKGGEFKDPGGRGKGLGFGSASVTSDGIGNFGKDGN
jgi:hypothetical protein